MVYGQSISTLKNDTFDIKHWSCDTCASCHDHAFYCCIFTSGELAKCNELWRCGIVVITTAQLLSTKSELRFCASSNPASGVSEIRDGEDLWQWSRLEIKLKAFRRSTIPQKQFIINQAMEQLRKVRTDIQRRITCLFVWMELCVWEIIILE